MKTNSLWRVEFKRKRMNGVGRSRAISSVSETVEVEVYAKNSEEAVSYATTYVGGITEKRNLCCVTRVI